jgi:predicted CxxxxCH...CXXCH cytochrome family protein
MSDARIVLGVLLAASLAGASSGGCLEPREQEPPGHRSSCTTCHGSPLREGDEVLRAAPPFDLAGKTDSPAVGAHLVHLLPNDIHAVIACSECHEVPEATDSPGHADTALPAELIFGVLAAARDHASVYEGAERRCDVYCHGATKPGWAELGVPAPRCERCHAMPPAAPHPAAPDCFLCHGDVVDAERHIIAPERHVDGVVDVEERCDRCHGSGSQGAPPPDLAGNTEPTQIGVGAHATHLAGGASSHPIPCASCHVVPESAGDPGHLDDTPHAEVIFAGVGLANDRMPSWSRDDRRCADSWCHGPTAPAPSPVWTDPTPLPCGGCHGMPPAAPHPQMTACALCHADVVDDAQRVIAPLRHVDGLVDVDVPVACNSCHGDGTSSAPPLDLAGNVDTTFTGVGAHRAHLEGTGIARKLECGECHAVPASVLAPGHLDSPLPAELDFEGVAKAFGASPSWDGSRCADSYCHGGSFPFGHASGGSATEPLWTQVDGTQKTCLSCHGLPPPPPHPPGPLFCSSCHPNVGLTLEILDPDSHVDGKVDL